MQKVTQEELNRIIPELIEKYGALSDIDYVSRVKELGYECSLKDIQIHFMPTLEEETSDLELQYQHIL